MIRRPALATVAVLCVMLSAGIAARGPAQTEVYCTLESAKIDKLSNATRVTLTADGIINGSFNTDDFVTREGNRSIPKRLKIIPFRLNNARTKLGSFVDVGQYPISHLSFSVPKDSREGVGLDVSLVLYRRSFMELIWLGRSSYYGSDEVPYVRIRLSDDQRSVIVTARSDRYDEPEETQEVTAPRPESTRLEVTRDEEGRISVLAVNAELGDVLSQIGSTAGLQIATRGGANCRASMSVKSASPSSLMRAIGRAYGLSVRSVAGIYYVTEGLPAEVDSYWAAPTASFQLQHIPAEQALDLLPEFLLRYVHVDAEKNRLVATGPPQLLDKLDADLRVIDQAVPQIEVSALAVEEVRHEGLDLASEIIYASGNTEVSASADAGQLGFRVVGDRLDDLHVKLRALERQGYIRTRICPSIVTASGEEATVFLGQRRFFAFQRTSYQWMGGEPRISQEVVLDSTDVGSRIWTRPWSGDGETITLSVFVQANTVLTIDDKGLPLVASRQAFGTRRITSGDTLVLGGLTLEAPSQSRRRVGLPVVGDVARGRVREGSVTRTLVLLSARASFDASDFALPELDDTEGRTG